MDIATMPDDLRTATCAVTAAGPSAVFKEGDVLCS
jgi:hypothetical protein